MPTYLVHGFRWMRYQIRVFVVLNQIDDAAPDWIIGDPTCRLILDQLHQTYDYIPNPKPETRPSGPPRANGSEGDRVLEQEWSAIKILEEHDPAEMREATRPYAFVADHVVRIDLDANVAHEMERYEALAAQDDRSWFSRLRDDMQHGEDICWYVLVCGDQDRFTLPSDDDGEEMEEEEEEEEETVAPSSGKRSTSTHGRGSRWPGLRTKASVGESLRRVFTRPKN